MSVLKFSAMSLNLEFVPESGLSSQISRLLSCLLFTLGYILEFFGLVTCLGSPISPMFLKVKVKVGVLRPVQQPGSYWDRSSELPLVGLEPTEVTAYD